MQKLYNTIKTLCTQELSKDWFLLTEPETIYILLEKKGFPLNREMKNMVSALKTLLSNDIAWKDFGVFENICDAISLTPVIPDYITKASPESIVATVEVMKGLKPKNVFSDNVSTYIGQVFHTDGFIAMPEPLKEFNKFLPKKDDWYIKNIAPKISSNIESFDNDNFGEDTYSIQTIKISATLKAAEMILNGIH